MVYLEILLEYISNELSWPNLDTRKASKCGLQKGKNYVFLTIFALRKFAKRAMTWVLRSYLGPQMKNGHQHHVHNYEDINPSKFQKIWRKTSPSKVHKTTKFSCFCLLFDLVAARLPVLGD